MTTLHRTLAKWIQTLFLLGALALVVQPARCADTNDATNTPVNATNGPSNPISDAAKSMTNADPVFSPFFHAEIGTVILQPFSISPIPPATPTSPTTYQLKLGSPDVRGMLQVVYENRLAWRATNNPEKDEAFHLLRWSKPDIEARIGYAFGGSGSQSSSTTGAGDFYGEIALGEPIWAWYHGGDANSMGCSHTLGIEAFTTFASDTQYSQLHTAGGIGVSYVTGIPMNGSAAAHQDNLQLMLRAGYALVDSPSISTGNTNGPVIGSTGDGSPRFTDLGAMAISAEVRYPIDIGTDQFGYLSLGGTAYRFPDSEPDQWAIYAAVSFNLEKLVSAIIPSK